MELTRILQQLWSRKLLLAVGLVLALFVTLLANYRLSLSPLSLESRTLSYGSASTQVLIDTRRSSLASGSSLPGDLASRAEVLAQFLSSSEARASIATQMGVSPDVISIVNAPNTVQGQSSNASSLVQQAASQADAGGLSVTYQVQLGTPIVAIFTRAPNADLALRLAEASAQSLRQQITVIGDRSGVAALSPDRIVLREVGSPTGGQVSTTVDKVMVLLVFVVAFGAWCVLILVGGWLRRDWRRVSLERRDSNAVRDSQV